MPVRGDERMVWAMVRLEEIPGAATQSVKLSALGLKPVKIPLQAIDIASRKLLRNGVVGHTYRIKLWEWLADKQGLA